jgi:hypothetical protein
MYTPKQEMVDKSQWQDDPFYGWRGSSGSENSHHHAANGERPPEPPRKQNLATLQNARNDAIRKFDDPFAGWLPDRRPPPPEPAVRDNPFHAWAQPNQSTGPHSSDQDRFANARLAHLPSFSCAPLSRFEGAVYDYEPQGTGELCEKTQAAVKIHQKYHQQQHHHEHYQEQVHPAENWKHDAFYGWRAHEGEHQTHRPLDFARNARLPSFAEGLASRTCSRADSMNSTMTNPGDVSGSSRCGILTVRVIAAYNLINQDTGILGDVSDPYVKVACGDVEKKTHTIDNDLNPKWNSHPFLFDVANKNQVLRLSVWDEDTLTADDPLGRMEIPLEGIIAKAGQPIALRDNLWDVAHGELEVELSFAHG